MRKKGQDTCGGVAAVVGVLLLVFIGCTATLHDEPAHVATARGTAPAPAAPVVTEHVAAAAPALAPTEPADTASIVDDGTLRVEEIRLTERDGRTAIVAQLSRPPDDVRHFVLGSPRRLVIDLNGPVAPGTRATINPAVDPDVAAVRVGVYAGKLRIVADLHGPAGEYVIERGERTVAALLGPSYSGRVDEVLYTDPLAPVQRVSEDRPTQIATEEAGSSAAQSNVDPSGAFENDADPAADAPPGADRSVAPERPAPEDPLRQQFASMDDRDDRAVVAETHTSVGSAAASVDAAPPPAPVEPVTAHETHATSEPDVVAHSTERPPSYDDGLVHDGPARKPQRIVHQSPSDAEIDALADAKPAAYALPVRATKPSPNTITETHASLEPYTLTTAREPRQYNGQKISLDFKDADIQNVLRILADVSGFNIITTEDVAGKLTMRLVDVPWDQALEAILRAKGLDMVKDGNIIRVSTVDQLKKEREAQRAADEAQKQVEPLAVRYIKVNYAKADEAMVKKVQEVLTERGTATWDERTNTIVIRDIARGLEDASTLITNFDTQTPQVLIESNIVEAQENFLRDLGIQWGYGYKAGPGTGNATGVNFPGTVSTGGVLSGGTNSPAGVLPFIADFPANIAPGAGTAYDVLLGSLDGTNTLAARLTALETKRRGKIISRPRVVTLNNVPAKIESVVIVRIKTPSSGTVLNNSTGAAGVAGSAAQAAFQEFRTGIILDVTPQVSSDGYIFLDVHAKSSNLEGAQTDPNIIPNEISREASSHVLIKDGETFVLGGIFRNVLNRSDRGIPFLHSIPVLGWAFKNDNTNDDRQELLVFITPRTVRTRGSETVASLPSAEALWQNRTNP